MFKAVLKIGTGPSKGCYVKGRSRPIKVGKDYGVVSCFPIEGNRDFRLGAFQTKRDWRAPSDLELIRFASEKLASKAHLFARIALNFPGIGLGGLPRELVLPIIQTLPDNVWVYEL